jgi:Lanthionine synthetase C-like protein
MRSAVEQGWAPERSATGQAKRIWTSLPSSLSSAWSGVRTRRHFAGRQVVAEDDLPQRLRLSPLDTLCCGNLGNAELLVEAAEALGKRELAVLASTRLHGVLIGAANSGAFGWEAGNDDENLGLFRGLAGVGYTLLRRLVPEGVPNVLIWE